MYYKPTSFENILMLSPRLRIIVSTSSEAGEAETHYLRLTISFLLTFNVYRTISGQVDRASVFERSTTFMRGCLGTGRLSAGRLSPPIIFRNF